jgi:NAD(P)-dependent dehydrogenase (short-subunit alcohol dehydrogenase family)
MLTAMYAKELRDTPIRVNAANPGRLICTPLRHGKAPDRPGPNRRPGAKSHGSPSGSVSSRRAGVSTDPA